MGGIDFLLGFITKIMSTHEHILILSVRIGVRNSLQNEQVVLTRSRGAEVHLCPCQNSQLKNLSGRDASPRRPFQWVNCVHYILSITGYTM